MSHKHKHQGIPHPKSIKEDQLLGRINAMLELTVVFADSLDDARKRLVESGRVPARDPRIMTINIQLKTLEEVINNCLLLQPDELQAIREKRDKERYEKHVEKLMDSIAPLLIITPPGFRVR